MSTQTSKQQGKVVVISGPSGVGKSTVCRQLCERIPADFSVSVTTRQPRPGEQGDRDYHYVTHDEFARLRDQGELVEWAEVYGHLYGTPRAQIQQAVAAGRTMILEIDIKGCIQVRGTIPEALAFYLLPPTPDAQRRRIVGRKTDSPDAIKQRLAKADGEIRYAAEAGCYDEFIINDDLEETVELVYQRVVKD